MLRYIDLQNNDLKWKFCFDIIPDSFRVLGLSERKFFKIQDFSSASSFFKIALSSLSFAQSLLLRRDKAFQKTLCKVNFTNNFTYSPFLRSFSRLLIPVMLRVFTLSLYQLI